MQQRLNDKAVRLGSQLELRGNSLKWIATFLIVCLAVVSTASAQQSTTLRSEGISGHNDKHGRSPVLTVQPTLATDRVSFLVDVSSDHDVLKDRPVRLSLYVNRQEVFTQLRSAELPGALGFDVGRDIATPPFNYTVVAEFLTEFGRPFTSMVSGAVYSSNLAGLFDCTLLLEDIVAAGQNEYQANNLSLNQAAENSFSLQGTFTDIDQAAEDLSVSSSFSVSGSTVQGSISVQPSSSASVPSTSALTGTAETNSSQQLSSFEASSETARYQLRCSAVS